MQGECNGKEGKRSFTALDTAEPKLILYKDNHKMEYSKVITQFFSLFPVYLSRITVAAFQHGRTEAAATWIKGLLKPESISIFGYEHKKR